MKVSWLVALACCVSGAARPAAAQEVTTPEAIATQQACDSKDCLSIIDALNRGVTENNPARLRGLAIEHIRTLKNDPRASQRLRDALGDVDRNYFRLVWLGRDKADARVVRTLLVKPGHNQPITTLPGITDDSTAQLIDVFISPDATALLDSVYTSTPVTDPLAAQLPAFVKETKVLEFLAGVAALRGGPTAMTYTVARARLPLARAGITVSDTIVIPGSVANLIADSQSRRDRLSIREARFSPCAQQVASSHVTAISEGLKGETCRIPEQPRQERDDAIIRCRTFLQTQLAASYRTTVQACTDAPGGMAPVLAVDKEFTDLVARLKEERHGPADSRLTNTPLTRFTFGVLSAAIVGKPVYRNSAIRAKVGTNGVLVHDPLPTVLTMAIVNIHPKPYDSAGDVTPAERFRFFGGTVITPDFGFGGGVSMMIVRGLAVNAGVAGLFVKSPGEGFAIGSNTSASRQSPLEIAGARVFFAGLSYVFR